MILGRANEIVSSITAAVVALTKHESSCYECFYCSGIDVLLVVYHGFIES